MAAVVFMVFAGPTVHAQAVSGNIVGLVTDSNKSVVVRAEVVATNEATGVAYQAVTNSIGEYQMSNLLPGKYTISVTSTGFSKSTVRGFEVSLNKTSTSNFVLQIKAASETVEVSSEAAVALDTTTAQVGTGFVSAQLTELPAATNNVLNLSLMTAGVTSSGGVGAGSGPAVGGQRPRNNNYTVEGIDNNSKSVTGPLIGIPSDAVSEFTVLQNQFSAEYGHSNGGQFNQVVKSGTNNFHGLAYEYFQNRNLNAIDAATARAGEVKNPRYDDNRFGGQVGGPIKRNKLFFFANYEKEPVGQPGQTVSFCAPTADGFSTLGSIAGLASNNLSIFKKYSPVASTQATSSEDLQLCHSTISVVGKAIPIGKVGFVAGTFTNNLRSINSVDWTISQKDSLRARYIYNRSDGNDTAATFPSFWTPSPNRYHLATFSEFHIFNPNMTSEFRLGFNRYYSVLTAPSAFPGMTVFPNITIDDLSGVNIGPDPNAPQGTIQNTYQGSESIIWNRDKHSLKFGAEFRDVISPQVFVQRLRGDYEWGEDIITGQSGLEQYLLDQSPNVFGERNATAPGVAPTFYGNQKVFYGFLQDDFRVTQKLTLNLGVRYEYTGVPLGEQQQKANAAASVQGLIVFGVPKAQKFNFVPRLGFAYSVDNNTVVRGGFGMGYDVLYDNLGILSSAPQYQVTEDVDTSVAPTPNFLASGGLPSTATIPDLATQKALTSAWVPDQKLPYAENWTLGVERTFAKDYTAEVRYVGTRGIHLSTQNRLNRQNVAVTGNALPMYFSPTAITDANALTLTQVKARRSSFVSEYAAAGFDQSNIVAFMPWSQSAYNGLATQLTRRFSHGLLFNAAWTWSKTMDDATADVFSTYLTPRRPQDFRNVGADYSRSALDHTHRMTLAVVYDLPFFQHSNWIERNVLGNWELAPAYTYQSPEYGTVQSNVDANLNGDSAGDRVFINPAGKKGTGTKSVAIKDPNAGNAVVGYYAADPNAYYVVAGSGTLPTSSRNTLPINPINDLDATAVKRISFTERYKFEFQAQAWNVLNHSQYLPGSVNNINSLGYTDGDTHSYLIPGETKFNNPKAVFSNNARNMQLAVKFIF